MAKEKMSEVIQGTEKEFLDNFKELCRSRMGWEVWADLMCAMACTISNVADRRPDHFEPREREYEECIKRLGSVDIPAKMLAIVVMALENNPEQDFLGAMYMQLNLGSHWHGQFFTPYSVCRMMSEICCESVDAKLEESGYISVCDPACGAGATLIATVNTMKRCRHNFQNHVLFVGQDIDRVTGMMCYIQLSLLGCAGYVCIADTLSNPLTGPAMFPIEQKEQELWYTPMFYSDVWAWRKLFHSMGAMTGGIRKPAETEPVPKVADKEQFFIFFDFDKEDQNGREQEIRAGI